MAAHLHLCEQCGEEYVCAAPRDTTGACVTRTEADRRYRLCIDCAEAEPSTYEAEAYDRARADDEQRHGRLKPNSYLGRKIAKGAA